MYDPMDPPAQGIPADPLPPELPEGDSGEVRDDDVEEPVFDAYAGTVDPVDPRGFDDANAMRERIEDHPGLERGLADANAGRTVTRPLRSAEMEDDDDSQA